MLMLFVYGTLKYDCCNNSILKNLGGLYLFDAETIYKYPMYKSEHYFPYLENQKGFGNIISGEVWLIPKESLGDIDYFEGVPDLYKRGSIEVLDLDGNTKECLCYFKAKDTAFNDKELLSIWEER